MAQMPALLERLSGRGDSAGQKPTHSLLPSMLSLLAKAQRRGQRDKETNTIECLL